MNILSINENEMKHLAAQYGKVRICPECEGVMLPSKTNFTDTHQGIQIDIVNFPIMRCQNLESCGSVHSSAKDLIVHVTRARKNYNPGDSSTYVYDCEKF